MDLPSVLYTYITYSHMYPYRTIYITYSYMYPYRTIYITYRHMYLALETLV